MRMPEFQALTVPHLLSKPHAITETTHDGSSTSSTVSGNRHAAGTGAIFALLLLFGVHDSLAQAPDCDAACLTDIARQYMQDVVTQDHSRLPWGDQVRFTENNVGMMIGDAFWGAGPGVQGEGLILPDPLTGNVVWYGITTEHGQAAYHGLRLKVENREITEVESYFGREGTPDLFAPVDAYTLPSVFTETIPAAARRPRERMIAIVNGYFNSKQLNDGKVFTEFRPDCKRVTNGVDVTHGQHWAAQVAQGCQAQLEQGLFRPVDRIRARRFPVVNEETGLVVALSLEDHATRYVDYSATNGTPLKVEVEYPNTRGMLELFKIRDGAIERIEGVSVFLLYYMHSLWQE